jgi:predicted transcriptional regulator
MREALTISLPPEMGKQIRKIAKAEKMPTSVIAREAISRYLLRKEMEAIFKKTSRWAFNAGFETDEDIFKAVS